MSIRLLLTFATILALACTAVAASETRPQTPTSISGARILTVDQARALLDQKAATFVDVRSPLNFGKSHLPGAILVAYKEKSDYAVGFDPAQDRFDLGLLPADKSAAIVFYSDGTTGWKSYKAAVLAVRAGHRTVFWMRDGFAAWTAAKLPSEQ
ncbi:MAG TPA: rhodanese-like domain-containing protein [Candidatus Accumulibacter phosphatis]|nr:MAG: thiosulfate sulfurtransferase [Candidatus Accumulibacter sp. SK-11]HRL74861.1 rhodanese-like domain-containing protein [Candidatus Accumulibacter phosphatis]HRQ95319.1 rhodanese-like domain-containing protein [Candidatus Accumulibacter phosphatis]